MLEEIRSRIIINNYTGEGDFNVVKYVHKVISNGKISQTKNGKQYTFCSIFSDGLKIYACMNKKGTHTFNVWK